MTVVERCAQHPDREAVGRCVRCDALGCAVCLRDAQGWCPDCRRVRWARRVQIGVVVAVMLSVPAILIAWGMWRRYESPARVRLGAMERARKHVRGRDVGDAELRRARWLIRTGRRAQARQILDRLLRSRPAHLGALREMASLARVEGRPAEVLVLTARVLAHASGAGWAWRWQAEAYGQQGRTDRAEQTLRRGLAATPRSSAIALDLAALLEKRGRLREAVELLHGVLQRRPPWGRDRLLRRLDALERRLE